MNWVEGCSSNPTRSTKSQCLPHPRRTRHTLLVTFPHIITSGPLSRKVVQTHVNLHTTATSPINTTREDTQYNQLTKKTILERNSAAVNSLRGLTLAYPSPPTLTIAERHYTQVTLIYQVLRRKDIRDPLFVPHLQFETRNYTRMSWHSGVVQKSNHQMIN